MQNKTTPLVLKTPFSTRAYTHADAWVTSDDPAILNKATQLTAQCTCIHDTIKRLFHFVRDEIPHSFDCGNPVVTRTARDVLKKGHGMCYAKSLLLAACCRSVGIPAGLCYQRLLLKDSHEEGYYLHGLTAVFLGKKMGWRRLDSRGNTKGICAMYHRDREQLAFPVRPVLDERDYPTVYAEPLVPITACLKRHQLWNLEALNKQLPATLDSI